MKLGVVMPVGKGRQENVSLVLDSLARQILPVEQIVAVLDGRDVEWPNVIQNRFTALSFDKHSPGMEQPRNQGVRWLTDFCRDITHVAFLDSDVIVGPTWHQEIFGAYAESEANRIMVCPYDWLPRGCRDISTGIRNDPRWPRFKETRPMFVWKNDISAGLSCFSGNLVWPVDEFVRVGGFWSEIHHGRCEDGELGLRAVAMGVPISFASRARGWHLWHPINTELAKERNKRDVPMLNARHPWVQGAQVFMVDRDGKAFDVLCSKCKEMIPTIGWWMHCSNVCQINSELKVDTNG